MGKKRMQRWTPGLLNNSYQLIVTNFTNKGVWTMAAVVEILKFYWIRSLSVSTIGVMILYCESFIHWDNDLQHSVKVFL